MQDAAFVDEDPVSFVNGGGKTFHTASNKNDKQLPREGVLGSVTREKFWSESNVSEDFDMALRLLGRGYDIRWATYSKGGFKEGVSLTVDDELNRWQKYAYGCNE